MAQVRRRARNPSPPPRPMPTLPNAIRYQPPSVLSTVRRSQSLRSQSPRSAEQYVFPTSRQTEPFNNPK